MQSIRWAISGFAPTLSASIGAAPSVTLVAPATQTRAPPNAVGTTPGLTLP